MTCFDRDELADLVAGLAVVAPWTYLAAAAFGWAIAVLAHQLMQPRPAARRARRRRRPPLAVLAHTDHNPDIDGVFAPPPNPDKETT